jgi:ubiquinone/menaquinone biosynthesis C-methylase UbiE
MSFDPLAPAYRWMEFVLAGEKLQRCRTAFLNHVADARDILILGEGNGRFLVECAQVSSSARITCVDESARMLELAKQRLERVGSSRNVQFLRYDALTWVPPRGAFDLIVTHFFLDCFRPDQLEKLLASLAYACRPGARWLLADFQIPDRGLARWRAAAIHQLMYAFFRLATRLPARRLTAPDPMLKSAGFVLKQRMVAEWQLLHSDLWQLG